MNFIEFIEKYPKKLKEPFTWVILFIGFGIGFYVRSLMLSDLQNELALKEDRIKQLEQLNEPYNKLDKDQKKFIKALVKYCKTKNIAKIVISRNGKIYKDNINVIHEFLEKDPNSFTSSQFESFIMSLPKEYVFNIPEARYGSPFVLKPTDKAKRKL
ncbi:MAG: hypothetical protein SCARUB_02576 [Candidatus Scalindua rubra]|uniref:Uncharacterized protein n=1 Tax=Candidatus Scalindua rubra TaxID=1872076 RepID=A0A1E3XBE4_9BACT|nr:MAG: hypothetical protein SCARUB_02576 [Candidatus Scalindua rubra]